MASSLLHPGRSWHSLVLGLLLLLQLGQHEGQNKQIPAHQQPLKSIDCCRDPGHVEGKFVVLYCPLIQGGLEIREWDADCLNTTNPPSGCQRDEFEANICDFLLNCSTSTCAKLNPTEGLISLEELNCSVTLNWQDVINCCHEASRDPFVMTSKSSWTNACPVMAKLSPGQEYNVILYRILNGSCSQEASINVTTRPSSVRNLTIENRTVDSLQIGWKPPRDPQSYTYTYCVCLIDCAIVNESPFLAKGLKGGTMYTIEVRAVTKSNVYGDTMTISVITAPNSPEKITVESYSPYYLSIAWNPPKDPNATDYLYRISWWREDGTQVGNYSILGFNYTICSLKPGLVYLVRVISEFSEILSEATKLWTLTSPLSPTHFHIQMINQTTVHFAWVNPNSPFSAIRLQWSPSDGSRGNETYPKPLNQAVLHGLTPSTNYTFTLFSTAGNGSLSRDSIGLQQHEATKPEQVSDLICLPLQDSWSLKLSWTCPASPVSKIVVLVSDKAWKNEPNCSESVVIQELQPAKVYQIKIKTFWYNQYAVSDTVECSINTTVALLGSLFAVLLLFIILCFLFFYFRRPRRADASEEQNPDVGLSGVLGAVPVSAFPRHCYEKLSDSAFGFAVEYQQLQDTGTDQLQSVAQQHENQAKNRYSNVLPYDHARVQLTLKPEDPSSDYINASYMPGFKKEKEFIAAQGPLPATLHDFWRMIWEQRVTTIVMLTNCIENGRVKCEHYWPLDYTPCTYDDITVSVITETILPDWSVRDFCIKQVSMSEVRHAKHYHYTSWPDHGVPQTTDTILRFRDLVREDLDKMKDNGPVLVHCSAGVGRTGTFISLDSLLCEAQNQGEIGVFSFVEKLRRNRPLMIQNEDQYVFLHQCLLDGIQSASTNAGMIQEHPAVYENILAMQDYEVSRV
ncbi:receptor-type tyrosine-protein phosphatase H isoform X2 [Crotalus tigris]|uniref:receptor-type tyrosine-protein phosphatase H isoform X2 n=1 Tax=Crotalus tigris TaxID=88082 RepID=UPI00192F4854|nr:receptor-type tyrosine-protein phosphatase H isoform X2 [Crotalus tigris]